MDSLVYSRMAEELEKVALTRWQKELENLPQEDVARIPGARSFLEAKNAPPVPEDPAAALAKSIIGRVEDEAPSPSNAPGASELRGARNAMWGPGAGELTAEQLERHRTLQGMMANRNMKELGGWNVNHPLMGPATMGGKVMVNPLGGTMIRQMAEGGLAGDPKKMMQFNMPGVVEKLRQTGEKIQANPVLKQHLGGLGLHNLPEPIQQESVDRTLRNAVVQHEGGEKALLRGLAEQGQQTHPSFMWRMMGGGKNPELAVPGRYIASHLGATPVMEEKQVMWRDPEAQKIFGKIRQLNPDDAYIDKMHRQYGGRPDMPLPMGGKQHQALEQAVAQHSPQTSMASFQRASGASKGYTHGMDVPKELESGLKNLESSIQGPHNIKIPGLGMKQVPVPAPVAQGVTGLIRKGLGRMSQHPAEPTNLASRIMSLRSLVRR